MAEQHLLAKIGQYAVIVNSKKQVLLLERARSGKWSLPGGRLDKEEKNWKTAFGREIKEETNLDVSAPRPIGVSLVEDPYQIKYCVFFAVEVKNLDDLKVKSKEHRSYKWFSVHELVGMVIDDDPQICNVIRSHPQVRVSKP